MITTIDHNDLAQAEGIQRVLLDSYQEEACLLRVDDFPPLRRTVAQIQAADSLFLGCWSDSDLVAVAEIEIERENKVNIVSFVVAPEMFRKGIGTTLLEHVLARFVDSSVTVSTATGNLPAIGLYSKHGFGVKHTWSTADGLTMVTLCKETG
jgi:ribosomal protein S18 acetylase RimI-like enzyme